MLSLRLKSGVLYSLLHHQSWILSIAGGLPTYTLLGPLLTSRQKDQMFDIADVPFWGVNNEEKQLYMGVNEETGWYHA